MEERMDGQASQGQAWKDYGSRRDTHKVRGKPELGHLG